MVVVDGQRLRVRRHLPLLRRAAEVSVSRAVLGHPGRDRHAAGVHPAGHRAARALRLGDADLRRVSDLHRHQAGDRTGDAKSIPRRTSCCGSPGGCFPWPSENHGDHFFAVENGRCCITPLFLVLLVVESTDVLFAVDSVPAIFGITNDPFIVFTSNIFAILGLRALYFLLAGVMDLFRYLNYGLARRAGLRGRQDGRRVLAGPPPGHAGGVAGRSFSSLLGVSIVASIVGQPPRDGRRARPNVAAEAIDAEASGARTVDLEARVGSRFARDCDTLGPSTRNHQANRPRETCSDHRRRGLHRQPPGRSADRPRLSRDGRRRRIDRHGRQPGRRARPLQFQLRAGHGGRQGAGPPPGGRRRRGLSPGGRGGRAVDLDRADPHHRNQHLSHRADAQRAVAPQARRLRGQALSGQHERGLRQEPQAAVDRGRRPGVRPDHAQPLVVRRLEGDRRVSGPGLLAAAAAAGGGRPVLQRRRARGRRAATAWCCRGSSTRRWPAGRWWSTTTASRCAASPTCPTWCAGDRADGHRRPWPACSTSAATSR